MSNPSTEKTEKTEKTERETSKESSKGGRGEVTRSGSGGALDSSQGQTRIADVVVQKIAGIAAREISGVRELGGGASRAFGAMRERIPGASASHGRGVAVEVGERQAAVDLEMLIEYGVSIPDLARAVRKNVMTGIERMTGLEVVEVNINVNDIDLGEGESEDSAHATRVE